MTGTIAPVPAVRRLPAPAQSPPGVPHAGHQARLTRTWIAGCVALCVMLRLPFIGVPLGIDEGGDAFIARLWNHSHGSMYGGYWLDRPPLLLLLYRVGLVGGATGIRVLGTVVAAILVLLCMRLALLLGGAVAARAAGVVAACMSASVVTGAAFTDSELFAATFALASVTALVQAGRSSRRIRWMLVAGVTASCALLVKQSFGDAMAAGLVFHAVTIARERGRRAMLSALAFGLAAVAPVALTLVWAQEFSFGTGRVIHALLLFRLDSLHVLNQSGTPPLQLLLANGIPLALGSGCALLLPVMAVQAWSMRRDVAVTAALVAWLACGCFGIYGGGNYFPHYFIQLVPVTAVLTGCFIGSRWSRSIFAPIALAVVLLLALANVSVGSWLVQLDPPQLTVTSIARTLRSDKRPGDTAYVLYARANILFYGDMPSPFPYHWSLIDRAMPDAVPRLRSLLRSDRRPTWIVEWQKPTAWGLDHSGATRSLLAQNYRVAATVCGHHVLLRRDVVRPMRRVDGVSCPQRRTAIRIASMFHPVPAVDSDSIDYFWS